MFGLPEFSPLYCDYAATTPVDPLVADAMHRVLTGGRAFGNPSSSSHVFGAEANDHVAASAEAVGRALGVAGERIVWTSGATESDNLAILGTARYGGERRGHIIATTVEHKAVIDPVKQLESEGFPVTWLTPNADGHVTAAALADALRDDTILVSTMWVNNELGTISDIRGFAAALEHHAAIWHVDAAQAFGKVAVHPLPGRIDLLALTGHKIYGPKGVGVLVLSDRAGVNLEPLLYGGGQQYGLRPGTLATHQIVGFAQAAILASEKQEEDASRLSALGDRLSSGLLAVDGVTLNGSEASRLPWLVNVSVEGVHGGALMSAVAPLALSAGSACNSTDREPSFVLKAIGLSDLAASASLRFSLGRPTTADDVDKIVARFEQAVSVCRRLSGSLVADRP
ncbi:MAG: cysteine desulfurase family protein [Pseudomonadota bacterium]